MAILKIDNVAMTQHPSHVLVIEPPTSTIPGAGLSKIVVQPMIPPIIEVRWGMATASARSIVAELRTKRGMQLIHMLSWTQEDEARLYHRNVTIPFSGYGQGPTMGYVDTFTVRMEEIRPMPSLALIELARSGTLTTGDGKVKVKTPAGGRILAINGFIQTLGSGGGTSTDVQVSNGGTDYLSTKGTFEVDSGTNVMENAVLGTTLTFDRADTIELDIDAISTNPADVRVYVYCLMFGV